MKNSFKKTLAAILIAAYGVWALDNVSYIDESGELQTANNVTVINSNGNERTLTTGWYILQGTFTNSGTLTVNGTVHLILANSSNVTVNGSNNNAGINVSEGNSLSIYAQSTVSNNGKLTATGGNSAAGIGGGGIVGKGGSGGTITIRGGTVTATGSSNGSAGIGGGIGGPAGTFTLNGNAVVLASSVGDAQTSRRTKGILFIGNAGTLYGSVTLEKNTTIPSGGTLTIPANSALTIPAGITLTNNGTITPANSSTVTVTGIVSGSKINGANTATPALASKTTTSIAIDAANILAATGQAVEYARSTSSTVPTSGWQAGTTFTGLTENTTYRIFARSKSDTYFKEGTAASLQTTTKTSPKAANFNNKIPTGHVYLGSALGFDISIAGMGAVTVYYDGSTNKPANAGNYAVTVDVAEGTEFAAASGIEIGEYVIAKRSVTIAGITAASKEYDGTTTAEITGTPTVTGKIGTDVVNVTNGTASFANKNIGTGKTVTFANFTLGGTNAGNYTLSAQPASVTANITAKPLTIAGVTAIDRTYNGTTTVELTGGLLNGVASGDAVNFMLGNGTIATPDAGSGKAVATNITLIGTGISNYTFTQPTGITVTISTATAKPLTITGVTAINRDYDGTNIVKLTGGVLNGVANGDAVSFVLGSGTVATPDAGNGKAVATNIALAGANASNYTLAQPTGITVAITPSTPIFPGQGTPAIGGIRVQAIGNSIVLENLPQGAKVEVYSLQGKRIYSAHPGNPKILKIGVQTKGMYIVKAGSQTARVVVR